MRQFSFLVRGILLLFIFLFASQKSIAQTTPDPGLPGTYAVTKDTFDLGNLAYKPDSFPNFVELRGSVHYPTTLTGGPFPLIVLLHGRHTTTYRTVPPHITSLSWPPATGYQSVISFDGYDYFARTMASHGYIVVSISCNAINAADASMADRGMNARGQLVQKHLDMWNGYNTVGGVPFGTKFVGKLDMTRIGTMGHSRGGEGVIYNALLNKSLGSPYGIKAVITLAPVDFHRRVMNGIPLLNIAPYCDGDVTSLSGVHFYDDARYNDTTDEAPKHSVLMMGANHNFYNTVWTPGSYIAGTSDDWSATMDPFCGASATGNGRLDTSEQKAAFNAYGSAFFRMYVGGDTTFAPILEVDDIHPPVSSKLDTTQVYVSWHPGKSKRKDINRTDTVTTATVNNLSGTVTSASMVSASICGGGLTMPSCSISTSTSKEPHRGTTTQNGMANAALRWKTKTAMYTNEIPATYQNTTKHKSITFRASVNYAQTLPVGRDLDFTVQLEDSAGKTSNLKVSQFSGALFYQPGTSASVLPKILFNTVKIPLVKFKGINQTKLRYIRFLFDVSDSGSVLISDLAFSGIELKPCGNLDAFFRDSLDKSYIVYFKDSTIKNIGDSTVYSWKFGDPVSGTADTSSLPNPNHKFSSSGVYKVCQYVSAYRSTGLVCTDSFCRNITLLPNSIADYSLSHISISPNPARDFLLVNGALPGDELELHNMCGQAIFKTNISQPQINLPQNLPTGVYFAIIRSVKGTVVHKVLIAR